MTIDLTKITTPFGLLDEETKAQLLAAEEAGMQLEFYGSDPNWVNKKHDFFVNNIVYRLAPGQVWPKPALKRAVHYVHLLSNGTTFSHPRKCAGLWGSYTVIGRARVELVEGQFDD